jgi:hypothetical protein
VLPIGEASLWIERGGRAVSPQASVSVTAGGEHLLALVTDYEEP